MFHLEKRFRELNTDGMCAYILENPQEYYVTAYKAMNNDSSDVFIDCNIVRHNGKPKFVYFTENMYSMEEFIIRNSVRDIAEAVYGVARAVMQINENGFLSIACLDTRLSRIYWDKTNKKAKLIYLPVRTISDANEKNDCEIQLCQQLAEALHDKSGDPEIQRICQNLQMGSIKNVRLDLTETFGTEISGEITQNNNTKIYAVIKELNGSVVLQMNKPSFVIGKSHQKADGIIENAAVSRQHCQIDVYDTGEVFITDMGSSNGTFLNGERLIPNKTARLTNGATLKIANQIFMVEIL